MSELLTVAEVAERLRVSPRTVQRLIADGRIRVTYVSSRRPMVMPAELDAYLAGATRRR